jgi:hypothetical protein
MATKPPPVRRAPKSRALRSARRGPPIANGRAGGGGNNRIDEDKVIKRYVRWLTAASATRQQVFIRRFVKGLQAMPPQQGVKLLLRLELLVKAVGPVTFAHSLICDKEGECKICDNETISFPNSDKVCCRRGPDDHNVIFN